MFPVVNNISGFHAHGLMQGPGPLVKTDANHHSEPGGPAAERRMTEAGKVAVNPK
jgi:hypothetical protein